MDPERWRQIEKLFAEALENAPQDTDAWLRDRYPDAPDLIREVLELLESAATDHVGSIVSGAANVIVDESAETAEPPEPRFEAYRVLTRLGRGGMGDVWLAERSDAAFEQQVAIKTMRDRWPSARGIERFEAERRILARLEHPSIARLIDGGTTPEGTPFVVMEYVRGKPIDEYCADNGLSVRNQLELFCRACEGVQYAHRNLIVHRDIKPSNVLVTDDGDPKLLDFGIAKLLDAEEDPGDETRTVERVMTPLYASPEQVVGERITTASDVYSLGVLLYRLLTGRSPYRLDPTDPGFLESISTGRVVPPSAAMLPTGENAQLRKRLTGDLDNILLKALRRESDRRYGTAAELADDIRRHLDGLPVSARPTTWRYRTQKFVRRNPALTAALAGVVVVLLAGVVTSSSLAARASREREEARRQTAIAREINDFLNVDLLGQADPYNEADREIRLIDVVRRASEEVDERFAGRPRVEAGIRMTLGSTFENLGDYPAAEQHYTRARDLLDSTVTSQSVRRERIAARTALGGLYYLQGRYDEALAELERVEQLDLPEDDPTALVVSNSLALTYDALMRGDEALAAMEDSVRRHRRVLGDDDPETLVAVNNLALTYQDRDLFDLAEPLLIEVLETRRRVLGPDHPDTVLSMASVGFHFSALGDTDRAETHLREAIEIGGPVLGEDHPWHTNSLTLLGQVLRATGRAEQAAPILEDAVQRQRRTLGEDSSLTQRSELGLALAYADLGRNEDALALGSGVFERRRAAHGSLDPRTLSALAGLVGIERRTGRCRMVVDRVVPQTAELREAYPTGDRTVGTLFTECGSCLGELGLTDDAIAMLEEARARLELALGPEHELTIRTVKALDELRAGVEYRNRGT